MSKFTKIQKILIGILLFLLITGGIARYDGNSVFGSFYAGLNSVKYALIDQPIRGIRDWSSDLASLWSVKDENDRLRHELAQTEANAAMNEEIARKNKEYESLMGLGDSLAEQYETMYANVISRDEASWNDTFVISKGSEDGVVEGMAILNTEGLIGKVVGVQAHTSDVKLLTASDRQNNVSVKISVSEDKAPEGILESYDASLNQYVIRLYEQSDEIEVGQRVISSGKGGVYPSGLYVGKVSAIEEVQDSIGKIIYVSPVEGYASFDTVIIIGAKVGE